MNTKKVLGNSGEFAVAQYLMKKGYTILARNITYRGGEIDLIAQRNEVLAFVEVKTRGTTTFAHASTITPTKRFALIRAAHRYLATHSTLQSNYDMVIRFDVAMVEGDQSDWKITYYSHAFTDENTIR
jgi:putative endonuclease